MILIMSHDFDKLTYVSMAGALISLFLFIIRIVLTDSIYDLMEWAFLAMFIGLFIGSIFLEEAWFKQEKARLAGKHQIH